jgi:glutathione synthase/RimK-type ligase-like ATP-grasp enzyme
MPSNIFETFEATMTSATKFTLAVMYDANEEEPPSSPKTLQKLIKMGQTRRAVVILGNYERLQELNFDALLIRQTTSPNNKTFELANLAEHHKIPVIDDTRSITVCCDKLSQMVRFANANIPTPFSRALRISTLDWQELNVIKAQLTQFKYPIVLKDPGSCFSRGVFKVSSDDELLSTLKILRQRITGSLIQAQEFIPTRFDWRIGVLNGRVLYCCQYNMAPGHWQVIKHNPDGTYVDGTYVTLRPDLWPEDICSLAVKAAKSVGNGLYGVDIKETKKGLLVIEVNDNPSIDDGEEDKYGNVWESIIEYFRKQIGTGEKLHADQDHGRVTSV